MGLFGALARGAGLERKAAGETFGSVDTLWRELFGWMPSKSGVSVTWQTALKVTTVLACTRRIADGNATVPCRLFQEEPGSNTRREAREHPLYDLFVNKPNGTQNTLEFRETASFHAVIAGNAYAFVNRVGGSNGRVAELIQFEPETATVERKRDRELVYRFRTEDGTTDTFAASEVWHLRGPSWNGFAGIDAVRVAREALGLAIATEETLSTLHANGGRPSGILAFKNELSPERIAAVKENWALVKKGGTAVLDGDATWTAIAQTQVDAQHIELRSFQGAEICRALQVLPIMAGFTDKTATYASVEQMLLAHLMHTVRPWHTRLRESMDAQLLTAEERRAGFYFEFDDRAFLRASLKDQAEFNKAALGGGSNPGYRTPNEVRRDYDEPPIKGGDHLYAPTNAGPIGADGIPQVALPRPKEPSDA